MPWSSGGKRGARSARHGMSSSRVLATIFASWPLTALYSAYGSMDGFTVLIRCNKRMTQRPGSQPTLGRQYVSLSTQQYTLAVITNPCARESMPYDRHQLGTRQLPPRLIPHSLLVEILQRVTSSCPSLPLFSSV